MQLPKNYRRSNGTIEWKKLHPYIQYHLKQGVTCTKLAEEINCTLSAFSTMMTWWRQRGVLIPNMKKIAGEGAMRTVIRDGARFNIVKRDGKWRQVGRAEDQSCIPAQKRKTMPSPKEPKKEIEKLPTKVVDVTKMKLVRVSKTTHIQVPIDMPNEVAIEKWKKKYQQ